MQARIDLCRKRFDRMDVYLVRMEKREGRDGKNKRRYLPRFIDRWTIEYVRTFAHPIDRIWRAITDPREFRSLVHPRLKRNQTRRRWQVWRLHGRREPDFAGRSSR